MVCRGLCGMHSIIRATYADVSELLERRGLSLDAVCAKRQATPAPLNIVNMLDSDYKMCRTCRIYIRWAGNRCPCCRLILATKSKASGSKYQNGLKAMARCLTVTIRAGSDERQRMGTRDGPLPSAAC